MPATPSDIAKFTSDGVIVTSLDAALKTAHPEAEDDGNEVIDMFFDSTTHAQVVLTERFALLSQINAPHEAVVVEESLGLGSTVPLTPSTPCFRVVDDERGIDAVLRTRAYAYEAGSDQFSIELMA
jgi:hypothetical protein